MQYTDEQKEMMAGFKWDEEPESTKHHPDYALSTLFFECVDKIVEYVLSNLELAHYEGDDTFEIPIPVEIHPLLGARYESQYSEESRMCNFDLLRGAFRFKSDDFGYKLLKKISLFFRESEKDSRIRRIKRVDICDEPSMEIVVAEKIDEKVVPVKSEEVGKSVTVEIEVETA